MTVDPLQPYVFQLPQSDNCHKDRAPTVNKAIIVSRHVGRRYPTTNQRNTKMIVIMMIMIIVIIIINIIMSMGLPNTSSRSKHAGGNHPTHTTPQGGKGGNHTEAGGKQPTTAEKRGGGGGLLSGPGPPRPHGIRPPHPVPGPRLFYGRPLLPAVPDNRNEPTQTRGREDDGE